MIKIDECKKLIGKSVMEIPTPALVIDLDGLDANIKRIQDFANENGVSVRPHIKAHKSTYVVKKQIEAGAIGVCCATIDEVQVVAEAGIPSILLTNEIVSDEKINRYIGFVKKFNDIEFITSIDSKYGLERFSDLADLADTKIKLVLEIDTGALRCGVQTVDGAIELIDLIHKSKNLKYAGLTMYNSSISMEPDTAKQQKMAEEAYSMLEEICKKVDARGYERGIVSTAGSGDYQLFGKYPSITEIQPGAYVYSDLTYLDSLKKEFRMSMRILATNISSPEEGVCIFDAGFKWISFEFGVPKLIGYEDAEVSMKGDEHSRVVIPNGRRVPKVGEKGFYHTTHVCTTNNMYPYAYGVRNEIIETVWPIDAK